VQMERDEIQLYFLTEYVSRISNSELIWITMTCENQISCNLRQNAFILVEVKILVVMTSRATDRS
jgi:hypothetical protein